MRHRLLRHPLGRWVDPSEAWAALLPDAANSFWLDDGASTGTSYLGSSTRVLSGPDVLDRVRPELASVRVDPGAGGFSLGWVGWLGYELRAATMGEPVRESRYPDAALMFVDRALAFDHAAGEVWLLALGGDPGGAPELDGASADEWPAEASAWRDSIVAALAGLGEGYNSRREHPAGVAASPATASVTWRYSDDEYLGMIEACQRAITAGDAYQLCLTTEASVDVSPDPFASYLALRESSPSHHGGLVIIGDVALLSASPEQFLAVSPDGLVSSSPIKGTRRRGTDAGDDARLVADLEASDKERAENLMIVDLMRNDIGRISEVGSVSVPRLLEVETYAHVHQLVSEVTGRLAPGLGPVDAVVACLPAGSMTGAPKLSATRILDALERRPRGIYAGAFGYLGLDGAVDLAMVIRSIVIDGEGSTVGSGGGITALSIPGEELDEVRLKAAALLAVLGVDESSGPRRI